MPHFAMSSKSSFFSGSKFFGSIESVCAAVKELKIVYILCIKMSNKVL